MSSRPAYRNSNGTLKAPSDMDDEATRAMIKDRGMKATMEHMRAGEDDSEQEAEDKRFEQLKKKAASEDFGGQDRLDLIDELRQRYPEKSVRDRVLMYGRIRQGQGDNL